MKVVSNIRIQKGFVPIQITYEAQKNERKEDNKIGTGLGMWNAQKQSRETNTGDFENRLRRCRDYRNKKRKGTCLKKLTNGYWEF